MPNNGSGPKFADEEHWLRFYDKYKNKFEWYGDFESLGPTLDKYLKVGDEILHMGCGNSQLADELYDCGYRHITSFDNVEKVINQQIKRNQKKRPTLKYEVQNVHNLTYESASYPCIIDKGLLDALASTSDESERESLCLGMFNEVDRVLKPLGRYISVSLAQDIVLSQWIKFFGARPYMMRVQCLDRRNDSNDAMSQYTVFVLVATKMKLALPPSMPKFEFINQLLKSTERYTDAGKFINSIQECRTYAKLCTDIVRRCQKEERHINLTDVNNRPIARVIIVDQQRERCDEPIRSAKVVSVQAGDEFNYFYATPPGRRELLSRIGTDRIYIAMLVDGGPVEMEDRHNFIKTISIVVNEFTPMAVMSKQRLQFIQLDRDSSEIRQLVDVIKSAVNGDIYIEDVIQNGNDVNACQRQMRFGKHAQTIQSEALLNLTVENDNICWKKAIISQKVLTCAHHIAMKAAINFELNPSILLLGLGAGVLAQNLVQSGQCQLIGVEIDPAVVEVGIKHFGLDESKIDVKIEDALIFVEKSPDACHDVILVDCAGNDPYIRCPLPRMLDESFLQKLSKMLRPDGIVVINVLIYDKHLKEVALKQVAHNFAQVLFLAIPSEHGAILYCSNDVTLDMRHRVASRLVALDPFDLLQITKENVDGKLQLVERPIEKVDLNSQIKQYEETAPVQLTVIVHTSFNHN